MYKLSPIIRDNKKKISRRLRRNQFLRKKFHADIKIHYATRKKSNFIEHNSFKKKKKPAYSHMITRETRDGNLNIKNRNGINRWYNFIKSSIHDKLIALFSKKKKENDIKYKS